ncbi:hypothetical protein LHYA1_G004509 [Lachnellula hyalina]|uniref:Uncharacterized protein n=1 Tax=Lachnellula hyalina TaxID=1316788 RepID=A0A8H8TZR0_9HELO|nr:uncharacterized protein LHYA1_G004509 [Lachnellula hyalina]TVY26605.1 hypothetical protein LHYA1_G004509 [Lachnellula hyalina]
MISSLQPQRPKVASSVSHFPPQSQPTKPANQQPTRFISGIPQAPRCQIEAMPPFDPSKAILDASKRHPVFFTDRLVKAPNGVLGGWVSPVAKGL